MLTEDIPVRGGIKCSHPQMHLTLAPCYRALHRSRVAWNTFGEILYFPFHNINSLKTDMDHCVQHITQLMPRNRHKEIRPFVANSLLSWVNIKACFKSLTYMTGGIRVLAYWR